MTDTQNCPDVTRLQALLDGTLPEEAQAAMATHLESCSYCQHQLELLAGGNVVLPQDPAASEHRSPGLEQAMLRLKGELSEATLTVGETRGAPLSFGFLGRSDNPRHLGRLGGYEILELIGRGGMGIVFKGRDRKLERLVAVKVLSPELASSVTARKRFLREAQAAAAVTHEHVVTIHAVDEVDGTPFLVMEYIVAVSLEDRIQRSGHLRVEEILRIGMQAAAGLAAAHAQGLVHRDIKPSNILLENGVERVKITDFGLARVIHEAQSTQSNVVAGTPQYMSPEQARGETVDHRSDLFSLGSVLYAMCTGRSPFRAETPTGAIHRVCDDAPRPIREVNPDIPDWLVAVIDRLLEKKPENRFQSATEVAEVLGQYLAHVQQPSQVALPVAQTYSGRAARRGDAWPWVAATSGALLAVVALSVLTWSAIRNRPNGEQTQAKTGSELGLEVPAPPDANEIDLLTHVQLPRDAPRSRWQSVKDGTLAADSQELEGAAWGYWSCLKVPFVMPREYDLIIDIDRKYGTGTLAICFATDGGVQSAQIGKQLGTGPATVHCEVRSVDNKSQIRVVCDDVPASSKRVEDVWPRLDDNTVTLFDYPSTPGVLRIGRIRMVPFRVQDRGRAVFSQQTVPRSRLVAEDVLWRGGAVELQTVGEGRRTTQVTRLKDLPPGDFELVGIDLRAPANCAGAGPLLDGLGNLRTLNVRAQGLLSEEELLHLVCGSSPRNKSGGPPRKAARLQSLEKLDLGFTQIGDRGLASVTQFAQLRSLCLAGTSVSDSGVRHVAGLLKLKALDLSRTKVSDIKPLTGMAGLEELNLEHAHIADEAVAHLQHMPALKVLSLACTNTSDSAVSSIIRLTSLQQISIVGTRLSGDGLKAIKQALAGVTIEHSLGAQEMDLLSQVDLDRAVRGGDWRWDGKSLVSPFIMGRARLEIPYSPPREFLLEAEVRSPSNFYRSVLFGVPYGSQQAILQFDSWPQLGSLSGLLTVDGCTLGGGAPGNEATAFGRLLAAGQVAAVRVIVRESQITATCGDRLIVNWTGKATRLAGRSDVSLDKNCLFLGAFQGVFSFSKIRLTPISCTGPATSQDGQTGS